MKIGESDVWELTFMQGYDSLKLKEEIPNLNLLFLEMTKEGKRCIYHLVAFWKEFLGCLFPL